MKNTLFKILTQPIVQIIVFSWILVGSAYFGGFYLYFLVGGISRGEGYAITGCLGIAVLSVQQFYAKKLLQAIGSACLIGSLFNFYFGQVNGPKHISFTEILPLLSLISFCVIQVLVLLKLIRWKNY